MLEIEFDPVTTDNSALDVIAQMEASETKEMAVADPLTGRLVGRVLLMSLISLNDKTVALSSLELSEPVYVDEHQHVFEVARQMLQHELSILPVVSRDGRFLGVVHKKRVLDALSSMLNLAATGSVITVELESADFTLSEIVHLIESESARILAVAVDRPTTEGASFSVSIKLDIQESSAISNSLRRHGYVVASENRSDFMHADMTDRADELIRYLDV